MYYDPATNVTPPGGVGNVYLGDPGNDVSGGSDIVNRPTFGRWINDIKAKALRRQQLDFLMPGNRYPGVGGQFNPGAKMGFQMPGNSGIVPPMNAGTQLADINPNPPTYDQYIASGGQMPQYNQLPTGYRSGAGMGFMMPGNLPKRTGGPGQMTPVGG